MQTMSCKQCGEIAQLERQSFEYVVRLENGVDVYVLSKTKFVFDCPKCGQQVSEELAQEE